MFYGVQGDVGREAAFCTASAVVSGHFRKLRRRRMASSATCAIISSQRCIMSFELCQIDVNVSGECDAVVSEPQRCVWSLAFKTNTWRLLECHCIVVTGMAGTVQEPDVAGCKSRLCN